MYSASDVVEMGEARNLILSDRKEQLVWDDSSPETMESGEYFDE